MKTEFGKYFRLERLCLKYGAVSIEGTEGWMYRVYSAIVLTFFVGLYPILLMVDLTKQGEFNEVVVGWFYALAIAMDGSIIIYTYFIRDHLRIVVNKLESHPFLAHKSRGAEHKERTLLSAWFSFHRKQGITLLCTSIITVSVPICFTLAKRAMTTDHSDWKLAWGTITFFNVSHSPNFELVWLYQNLVIFYISINMIPIILMMIGILALVTVQLKMLQSYLKRLVKLSIKEDNTDIREINNFHQPHELWKSFYFHMENAIVYHLKITNVAKEVETAFHGPFFIMFMVTLVLMCLEVYRASLISITDAQLILIGVESITAFFPVMMVCYYGEELAFNSLKVSQIAFETDFVGTDKRFQKNLILIIRRSQKIIRMKAGALIEISMNTMIWILRTSFSAYMMLRTINSPTEHV
ncbi:hypothetical protein FQR65_LT05988 [Abscondita terminalis]|nr:hypothetical protein FQR65_LT05988 [Abscondita terminalis]